MDAEAVPTLTELRLEVFRDCPVKCQHCYQAQSAGAEDVPSQLFADEARLSGLLDEFVALGGRSISLSGGELLLPSRWARVRTLLLAFAARGIGEVRINTSLAGASETILAELAALPIATLRVQTGLDGRAVHDWLRFDGALDRTLAACRKLSRRGVTRISARTTLFFGQRVGGRVLDNLAELDWILEACRDHGISRLKTKVVHPSGLLAGERAQAEAHWRAAADPVLAPALRRLVETRLEGQTAVRLLLTNPLPKALVPFAIEAQRRDPEGVQLEVCQCGSSHVAIAGDGSVFRCLYNFGKSGLSLGNVLQSSLREVITNARCRSYVKLAQVGRCAAFEDNLAAASSVDTRHPHRGEER